MKLEGSFYADGLGPEWEECLSREIVALIQLGLGFETFTILPSLAEVQPLVPGEEEPWLSAGAWQMFVSSSRPYGQEARVNVRVSRSDNGASFEFQRSESANWKVRMRTKRGMFGEESCCYGGNYLASLQGLLYTNVPTVGPVRRIG